MVVPGELGNLLTQFRRRGCAQFQLSCQLRMPLFPLGQAFLPFVVIALQLLAAARKKLSHLFRNEECLFGQPQTLPRLGGKFGTAFAVCLGSARHFGNAAPDLRPANNQLGAPVVVLFGILHRAGNCLQVVTVDRRHVKTIRLKS